MEDTGVEEWCVMPDGNDKGQTGYLLGLCTNRVSESRVKAFLKNTWTVRWRETKRQRASE